jgi:hypothetical protein
MQDRQHQLADRATARRRAADTNPPPADTRPADQGDARQSR